MVSAKTALVLGRIAELTALQRIFHKADFNAHAGKGMAKQRVGPAVQDAELTIWSPTPAIVYRQKYRGHSARREKRTSAALECGDALFHDIGSGIHQPGIDVAKSFRAKSASA